MSISRAESGEGQFPIPRRPELLRGLGEGAIQSEQYAAVESSAGDYRREPVTSEPPAPALPEESEHQEQSRTLHERPILLEDYWRFMTNRRGLRIIDVQPSEYKPVAEASVSFVAATLRGINERLAMHSPPKKPIRGLYPFVIHELAGFYDKQSRWSPSRQENFRQTYRDVNLGTAERFSEKIAELQIIGALIQQLKDYESNPGEHDGAIQAFNDMRAAYGAVLLKRFGQSLHLY